MRKPIPIYCEWSDAESKGGIGWQDAKEQLKWAKEPLPVCHTCGFLIRKTKHFIVVTPDIMGSEMASAIKIPIAWIRLLVRLKASGKKLPRRLRLRGRRVECRKFRNSTSRGR